MKMNFIFVLFATLNTNLAWSAGDCKFPKDGETLSLYDGEKRPEDRVVPTLSQCDNGELCLKFEGCVKTEDRAGMEPCPDHLVQGATLRLDAKTGALRFIGKLPPDQVQSKEALKIGRNASGLSFYYYKIAPGSGAVDVGPGAGRTYVAFDDEMKKLSIDFANETSVFRLCENEATALKNTQSSFNLMQTAVGKKWSFLTSEKEAAEDKSKLAEYKRDIAASTKKVKSICQLADHLSVSKVVNKTRTEDLAATISEYYKTDSRKAAEVKFEDAKYGSSILRILGLVTEARRRLGPNCFPITKDRDLKLSEDQRKMFEEPKTK